MLDSLLYGFLFLLDQLPLLRHIPAVLVGREGAQLGNVYVELVVLHPEYMRFLFDVLPVVLELLPADLAVLRAWSHAGERGESVLRIAVCLKCLSHPHLKLKFLTLEARILLLLSKGGSTWSAGREKAGVKGRESWL